MLYNIIYIVLSCHLICMLSIQTGFYNFELYEKGREVNICISPWSGS